MCARRDEKAPAVTYSDRTKFPQPLDKMYLGQTVRVSAMIQVYKGSAEIIVREPGTIEIVK